MCLRSQLDVTKNLKVFSHSPTQDLPLRLAQHPGNRHTPHGMYGAD
jgi:hypothetical protein